MYIDDNVDSDPHSDSMLSAGGSDDQLRGAAEVYSNSTLSQNESRNGPAAGAEVVISGT
jgi:hypothetical protein